MTTQSATTSAFVNEVEFNWKINDLSVAFTASGGEVMYSPEFSIGDSKCRLCLNKKIKECPTSKKASRIKIDDLTVDGITVDPKNYHIVWISLDFRKEYILSGGSLSIDMKGETITSTFGNPTGVTGKSRQKISFENQTSNIGVTDRFHSFLYPNMLLNSDQTIFCIGRHESEVEFRVKLHVVSPIINELSDEPVKETGLEKLSADMRAVLNGSSVNSDFSIECGGKTFPCHELILRARSSVLDAMFQNDMAEASSRRMTVVDVGPNTMAAVLEYMYTGGITVEVDNIKELIYIADKYCMEALIQFCFQKLNNIDDDMIVDFLFMADKHNLVEYKKKAMVKINMNKAKYMEDQEFMEKLQEVPRLLLELYKL